MPKMVRNINTPEGNNCKQLQPLPSLIPSYVTRIKLNSFENDEMQHFFLVFSTTFSLIFLAFNLNQEALQILDTVSPKTSEIFKVI